MKEKIDLNFTVDSINIEALNKLMDETKTEVTLKIEGADAKKGLRDYIFFEYADEINEKIRAAYEAGFLDGYNQEVVWPSIRLFNVVRDKFNAWLEGRGEDD